MDKRIIERVGREKVFFDNEAENSNEYWGWRTKTGKLRHFLRAKIITTQLKLSKGEIVLELGCGLGGITKYLVKSKAHLVITDLSPKSLDYVKKRVKGDNVKFKVEDAHIMNFPKNNFDAVIGNAILHHLEFRVALREIFRVLKPGGKILFFEPNMLNPEIFLERKVPFLRKLSRSSPDETAFVRWRLSGELKITGFVNISVVPYDFLYPAIPYSLAKYLKSFSDFLEKVPIIKEVSGSLIIRAEKR